MRKTLVNMSTMTSFAMVFGDNYVISTIYREGKFAGLLWLDPFPCILKADSEDRILILLRV